MPQLPAKPLFFVKVRKDNVPNLGDESGYFLDSRVSLSISAHSSFVRRSTAQPARDDDACGFPDMLSITK